MGNLILKFTVPTPAPENGYLVKYRVKGTSTYTTVSPNPTASPVIIENVSDLNLQYEATLQPLYAGSTCPVINVETNPAVVLSPFDYLVVRFAWAAGAGTDLDIVTGFVNTGVAAIDGVMDATNGTSNKWVGYGNNLALPFNGDISNSYAFWALDNTSTAGIEAVLVSFNKLITDFGGTISANIIEFNLNAVWYGAIGTGVVSVSVQTYLGGTMSKSGTNIINTGGTMIDSLTIADKYVTATNHNANYTTSQRLGSIRYDKTSKAATLTAV